MKKAAILYEFVKIGVLKKNVYLGLGKFNRFI